VNVSLTRTPLALFAGLAAGRYRWSVGLYRLDTGQRLPVVVAGSAAPQDGVTLPGELVVEP
jgi:hypothetical protein